MTDTIIKVVMAFSHVIDENTVTFSRNSSLAGTLLKQIGDVINADVAERTADLQTKLDAANHEINHLRFVRDGLVDDVARLQSWQEGTLATLRICLRAIELELLIKKDSAVHKDIANHIAQSQPQPLAGYGFGPENVMCDEPIRLGRTEPAPAWAERYTEQAPAPLPGGTPKTLLDFGYAEGNYTNRCVHCRETMDFVDKRCRTCKPCAEKLLAESQKLGGSDNAK